MDRTPSERAKAGWATIRDREARLQALRIKLKIFGYDGARVTYLSPRSKFRAHNFLSDKKAPFEIHVVSKEPVADKCLPVKQLMRLPTIEMAEKCVNAFVAYEQKKCWV